MDHGRTSGPRSSAILWLLASLPEMQLRLVRARLVDAARVVIAVAVRRSGARPVVELPGSRQGADPTDPQRLGDLVPLAVRD